MTRRSLLLGASALAGVLAASRILGWRTTDAEAAEEKFEVMKTDAEWKAQLSPQAYSVLRHEDTERPFTSALNNEKRAGTFHCAGCDLPLYASATKYDSGTGWPSFYEALPNAIGTRQDNSLFMTRTECHCRRCGGHLGHIFDDGPKPTGMRHCINGVSLTFKPALA